MNETKHTDKPILELMCGTGRVSIPLLEAGRELVCVDYSQGMLDRFAEKANEKNYRLDLMNADVCSLNLGKQFETILLPFHSLQEIIAKEKQITALRAIYNHLSDSGVFVCTLQNPKVRLQNADGSIRTMGKYKTRDNRDLVISYNNLYQNGLVAGFQFYETYDQNNQLIEKRYLEINFRPITFGEFGEMLDEVGFKIEKIYGNYDYADFDLETSPFMLYRLTKKASR